MKVCILMLTFFIVLPTYAEITYVGPAEDRSQHRLNGSIDHLEIGFLLV